MKLKREHFHSWKLDALTEKELWGDGKIEKVQPYSSIWWCTALFSMNLTGNGSEDIRDEDLH